MKKQNLFSLIVLFSLLSAGFSSCDKDDDPTFEASKSTIALTAEDGASSTFDIKSNTNWTLASNESWCKPSVTSGNGDATITVTATENEDIKNSRTATITLTPNGMTPVTLTVTQLAGDSKPVELKTVVIKATEWEKWHYFSFAEGKEVGTGGTNADDDATWKARKDWDIAFHMANVRTNSGLSGSGEGGVYDTGKTSDISQVTEAATDGYEVDVEGRIATAMPPIYQQTGISTTLATWASGGMGGYTVSHKIYVVKTGDGKYAKVHLKDIYDDKGTTGVVTMEYGYQPDGSNNLVSK